MRKLLLALVAALSLSGCGYNDFQRQDEGVKAAWSEVLNNYQRRADLIPNLVATVQGAADFEKSTLVELTNARASVGSIKATPELVNDPEGFAKFQAAQSQMTGALSRLMAVAENYPQFDRDQGVRRTARGTCGRGESHRGGARPLHQNGGGLQCSGARIPHQPDGDDVRLQAEGQLRSREREGDRHAAEGRFQQTCGEVAASIPMRHILAALLGISVLLGAAHAEVPVPPVKARVTDLTGTLNARQKDDLESRIAAYETRRGSQIAVLILPTTKPEEIEQYSIRVAEAWKIGRKGVDDGLILIVAKDDRRVRIEVGYGLEGVIPDSMAKRVIDERITPHFRDGDFYGGVRDGVDQLVRLAEGEKLPPPRPGAGRVQDACGSDDAADFFPFLRGDRRRHSEGGPRARGRLGRHGCRPRRHCVAAFRPGDRRGRCDHRLHPRLYQHRHGQRRAGRAAADHGAGGSSGGSSWGGGGGGSFGGGGSSGSW